jgi:CheY-like chemotaxis protein
VQKKRKAVLLFDDDYESMFPLKEHLEQFLDLQVELTANENLLDRLRHEQFDLICIDLMIHPMSLDANDNEVQNVHFEGINWQKTGLEFLRRLRRGDYFQPGASGTSPDVPVIVLSAIANYSVEAKLGRDISVERYVEKPFALDVLIEQMQHLLEE